MVELNVSDTVTLKKIVTTSLLAIFIISFVTLNTVNVVHQDLLDQKQTTSTLNDTEFYDRLTVGLQQELATNISKATSDDMDANDLVSSAITEEYTQTVVNDNIAEVYAFIDGNRTNADIRWELTGAEQRLASEIDDPAVQQDVNATVPAVVVIEEDVATGPIGATKTVINTFPQIIISCVLGILFVLGAEVYRGNSYQTLFRRTGIGISIASVATFLLSITLLVLLRAVSLSFEGDVAIDPTIISEGLSQIIANAVYTLIQQSFLLLLVGLVFILLSRTSVHRASLNTTPPSSSTNRNETESETD